MTIVIQFITHPLVIVIIRHISIMVWQNYVHFLHGSITLISPFCVVPFCVVTYCAVIFNATFFFCTQLACQRQLSNHVIIWDYLSFPWRGILSMLPIKETARPSLTRSRIFFTELSPQSYCPHFPQLGKPLSPQNLELSWSWISLIKH